MDYDDSKSVNKIAKILQKNYSCENGYVLNFQRTDNFSSFDLIDYKSQMVVEVKQRQIYSYTYPSTMIGYNKIIKARDYLKKGFIVFFVFDFLDGVFFYQFGEDESDLSIDLGGRTDRGVSEIKNYAYIDISKLQPL